MRSLLCAVATIGTICGSYRLLVITTIAAVLNGLLIAVASIVGLSIATVAAISRLLVAISTVATIAAIASINWLLVAISTIATV